MKIAIIELSMSYIKLDKTSTLLIYWRCHTFVFGAKEYNRRNQKIIVRMKKKLNFIFFPDNPRETSYGNFSVKLSYLQEIKAVQTNTDNYRISKVPY